MTNVFRIDFNPQGDDHGQHNTKVEATLDTVNEALKPFFLKIQDDGIPHPGFYLCGVVSTKPEVEFNSTQEALEAAAMDLSALVGEKGELAVIKAATKEIRSLHIKDRCWPDMVREHIAKLQPGELFEFSHTCELCNSTNPPEEMAQWYFRTAVIGAHVNDMLPMSVLEEIAFGELDGAAAKTKAREALRLHYEDLKKRRMAVEVPKPQSPSNLSPRSAHYHVTEEGELKEGMGHFLDECMHDKQVAKETSVETNYRQAISALKAVNKSFDEKMLELQRFEAALEPKAQTYEWLEREIFRRFQDDVRELDVYNIRIRVLGLASDFLVRIQVDAGIVHEDAGEPEEEGPPPSGMQ